MRRILAIAAALCALGGTSLAETPSPADVAHFAYDSSAPLNIKQVAVRDQNGVTVQDITYSGWNGDTVPAYLVIPKGGGKFAGIVWGHWTMPGASNANRSEFLDEAVALAPQGVVSLLIDAPMMRPGFKPPASAQTISQQVVDLRRGVDLLISRSDVDAARIGYVGHSFDSNIGAALDGVDKRFAAFVLMGGPQSNNNPEAWTNPRTYAGAFGPAPALFQYGLHDQLVPLDKAKDFSAMAAGPKTVIFYDADHALNDAARTDRDDFLSKTLKLKP